MKVRPELLPKPVDPLKIERAVQLILAISAKHETGVEEGLEDLVAEYNQLTGAGHTVEDSQHFTRIYSYTDYETYAETALRPVPKIPDVTDEEYIEILGEFLKFSMSEVEQDYWLNFLVLNLKDGVSDLIFHSMEELTPHEILARIRAPGRDPIVLYPPKDG